MINSAAGLALPAAERCRLSQLVETFNDRAIDREARASERRAARGSDEPVLHEGQNLKLFAQLAPIPLVDGSVCPLIQLSVPCWTVIERNRRNSAKYVVGSVAVCQV